MIGLLFLLAAGGDPEREPLPRYLEPAEVEALLRDRQAEIAGCGADRPDGAWPVDLRIEPDGRVALAPGALPEELALCVQGRLDGRPLPAHDEDTIELRATLVLRAGLLSVGPLVEVLPRPLDALFLYVPAALDAEARAAIRAVLGLDPTPQE